MSGLFLLVGLLLTVLGSAGAAALVTTARSELAEAVSRRLRGADVSFAWLADRERLVVSSMALASLGVTLVGVVFPGILETLSLPQLAVVLFVVVVPATLAVGYLVPRWLTLPRASRVVHAVGGLLKAVHALLRVALPGGKHPASDGVEALAREGSAAGLRQGDELAMVGGVMSFAERPVREVMTPRTDVVGVAADAPRADVLAVFAESGYTRLPVYRESLDDIIGMVHAFDLFKLGPEDQIPVRPVAHAPESRSAADLLVDMQRERRHFAVVLDEFGGTAGIVTLENLLEALVGEISDEDDAEAPQPEPVREWLEVDGAESSDRIAEHFGVSLPETTASSFAGVLVERLGRIPQVGERFRIAGLDVDVLAATPARIDRMVIRPRTPAAVPLDREPA
jgi:CBS domain containing-hemolysin-like protein